MLIVMGLCAFVTWLARHATLSPWGWSLYLLFGIQVYHLTQIPVLGILFWGYGVIYGLTALGILWVLSSWGGSRPESRGSASGGTFNRSTNSQ